MKRFIYIIPAILLLGMLVSCSIDDVTITDTSTCLVNVTVNLTDFFSCYDFTDTKHSVDNAANSSEFGSNKRFNSLNPAERYKSFNEYYFSNPSLSIETNVLVYNDKGLLVEAKKDRTGNTEPIDLPFHFQLDVGKYTVIATLTFFRTTSDAYWTLKEEENLSTVYL